MTSSDQPSSPETTSSSPAPASPSSAPAGASSAPAAASSTPGTATGTSPMGRRGRFGRFGAKRRVVAPEEPLDYKNVGYLAKFVSANGRIQGRKRTNFSGQNQRKLATAIKRARIVGLLPFVGRM